MIQYLSYREVFFCVDDSLFERLFDLIQEIRTQELFTAAVLRELVEDIGLHFDQIDTQIEAIKKQLVSDEPNTQENLDKAIYLEQFTSLKKQLVNTTRKLMYFLETKSKMADSDIPYQLINDIEQAESEVLELRLKIEEIGRKL